jgi:hypothetical protein
MNAFERDMDAPATVHYGEGEYVVLKPGRHVVCAVSGRAITLDALRYWSSTHQEAYAGAKEAMTRWKQLNPG